MNREQMGLEAPRERLLIVGEINGQGALADGFASRHPDWEIGRTKSFLSGIAEVCRHPARAVLAVVGGAQGDISKAVAGLREAGGRETRIVLCCAAESEPAARAALSSGADEYLVQPVEVAELESAIGMVEPPPLSEDGSGYDAEFLERVCDAMGLLDQKPSELLMSLAELVRSAVDATGVMLSVRGAGATAGRNVTKAVLTVPVGERQRGNEATRPRGSEATRQQGNEAARQQEKHDAVVLPEVLGTLVIGEKERGPYTPGDVERLEQCARLIGRILHLSAQQRLWRELALTDSGSGLPNRRYLHERLPAILERAHREHFAVTVLLFDVDNFKEFNDRHGHDAGDEILRVVGQLFRKTCREQDVVTRYGGDEFAVVFWDPAGPREPGSQHPQQALSLVDRFIEALRAQQFSRLGPEGGSVTISGGLATFPWDAATMDALLTKADQALLSAKRAGKNRVVVVGG